MLTLIGTGIGDEKDLTLRGIDVAKEADFLYAEKYTGKWGDDISEMEKVIGKKIGILMRPDVEEKSGQIIEKAKSSKVAILVKGDPMVATTHSSLLMDARKAGVEVKVIHNSSITSAVCETGLHAYKFGATVTIPFPEKVADPGSTYQTILKNRQNGLHTLCLLDIVAENEKYMTVSEGLEILSKLEKKFGNHVLSEGVVAVSDLGKDAYIIYGKLEEVAKKDSRKTPAVVVIPGKLHFTEKEFLESFR